MGILAQMDAGIRFLQVQTHRSPVFKQMKACHTSCLAEDAGTLEDYLLRVKGWLLDKGHEREVVTVLITNGDYVDVGAYEEVFKKLGLIDLVYMPDAKRGQPRRRRRRDGEPAPTAVAPPEATISTSTTTISLPAASAAVVEAVRHPPPPLPPPPAAKPEWPTLNEMIKTNQRLVIFLDYGATPKKTPYILDEFDYFWESPFDTIDPSFSQCAIDRPVLTKQNQASIEKRMYILNHYLDTKLSIGGMLVPNRKDAHKTNALEGGSGVRSQVERCKGMHGGRVPRVVLMDYFDVGEFRRVEGWLNGFER